MDVSPTLVAALAIIALVVLLWHHIRTAIALRRLESTLTRRVADAQQGWIRGEQQRIRDEEAAAAQRRAVLQFEEWRADEERAIREDAINRSRSVIVGKVTEHLVPFLPNFPWNPKDARFIGSPIDILVFDGMDEGDLREIILVEVKTGGSALTPRERQIREAIQDGRIAWEEIRVAH